jgi:lysophospholipid acyltransferase
VKLVFSFLLSYPLAAVLKRIPDSKPERKNAFIVAYGPHPESLVYPDELF